MTDEPCHAETTLHIKVHHLEQTIRHGRHRKDPCDVEYEPDHLSYLAQVRAGLAALKWVKAEHPETWRGILSAETTRAGRM